MYIQKIKEIKEKFENENKRGSVNECISMLGGLQGILEKYKSVDAFCRDLKNAEFDKGYISRIRTRLKK